MDVRARAGHLVSMRSTWLFCRRCAGGRADFVLL